MRAARFYCPSSSVTFNKQIIYLYNPTLPLNYHWLMATGTGSFKMVSEQTVGGSWTCRLTEVWYIIKLIRAVQNSVVLVFSIFFYFLFFIFIFIFILFISIIVFLSTIIFVFPFFSIEWKCFYKSTKHLPKHLYILKYENNRYTVIHKVKKWNMFIVRMKSTFVWFRYIFIHFIMCFCKFYDFIYIYMFRFRFYLIFL